MTRRSTPHKCSPYLDTWLREYADSRALDFHIYSEYHRRVIYDGVVVFDWWLPSGKYYVKDTDYLSIRKGVVERGGETGVLPGKRKSIIKFLDELFYAADKE